MSLADYDRLQRSAFPTGGSSLSGSVGTLAGNRSPFASFQRNDQAAGAEYEHATRLLHRAARRGDANAAMSLIGLRQRANIEGYQPGGIKSAAEEQANAGERFRSMIYAGRAGTRLQQLAQQRYQQATGGMPTTAQAAQPATTAPGINAPRAEKTAFNQETNPLITDPALNAMTEGGSEPVEGELAPTPEQAHAARIKAMGTPWANKTAPLTPEEIAAGQEVNRTYGQEQKFSGYVNGKYNLFRPFKAGKFTPTEEK